MVADGEGARSLGTPAADLEQRLQKGNTDHVYRIGMNVLQRVDDAPEVGTQEKVDAKTAARQTRCRAVRRPHVPELHRIDVLGAFLLQRLNDHNVMATSRQRRR